MEALLINNQLLDYLFSSCEPLLANSYFFLAHFLSPGVAVLLGFGVRVKHLFDVNRLVLKKKEGHITA